MNSSVNHDLSATSDLTVLRREIKSLFDQLKQAQDDVNRYFRLSCQQSSLLSKYQSQIEQLEVIALRQADLISEHQNFGSE